MARPNADDRRDETPPPARGSALDRFLGWFSLACLVIIALSWLRLHPEAGHGLRGVLHDPATALKAPAAGPQAGERLVSKADRTVRRVTRELKDRLL